MICGLFERPSQQANVYYVSFLPLDSLTCTTSDENITVFFETSFFFLAICLSLDFLCSENQAVLLCLLAFESSCFLINHY